MEENVSSNRNNNNTQTGDKISLQTKVTVVEELGNETVTYVLPIYYLKTHSTKLNILEGKKLEHNILLLTIICALSLIILHCRQFVF